MKQKSVYSCSSTFADTKVVLTNGDERTSLMRMNLTPYRKKLDKEPVIRYLYTGREYNVETGDYYYRARVMDSSIGRFSSKDPIVYLNLYRYVRNNPLYFIDIFGNAYFAKIGFFGGKYDISNEGSLRDLINLQWVHEGILWDDMDETISGFKLGGYEDSFDPDSWFNLGDRNRYTEIGEWYDDDLLQQAVDMVEKLGMGYDFLTFNCQDWSDLVRWTYDMLAGD